MNKPTKKIIEFFNVEDIVGQNRLVVLFSYLAVFGMCLLSYDFKSEDFISDFPPLLLSNLVPTTITLDFGIICNCLSTPNTKKEAKTYVIILIIFCFIYGLVYVLWYVKTLSLWAAFIIVVFTPLFVRFNLNALTIAYETDRKIEIAN